MENRKKLLFIGDSLTEYFDWQGRFPQHDIINSGVAGETIEGLAARIDRIILETGSPDMIFIMTGINNIAMEDYDIIHLYNRIINRLFSVFPKSTIVIQSILPVRLPWINNKIIRELNLSLRDIARDYMAEYEDIYAFFTDQEGNLIDSYLLEDGVHLSEKGYEVWSRGISHLFD